VERNARSIAGKNSEELKRYLEDLVNAPVVKDNVSRDSRLAISDIPWTNRGAPDGRLTSGGPPVPPIKPPLPPAGTTPPEGPPPPPDGKGYKVGAVEILLISQADGMSTIRRQVHHDGKVEADKAEETWNRRDLLHGIRAQFEAGGRTFDKEPLRLSFDRSFSRAEVDRVMKDLALHDTRAGSDRLIIQYGGSPEAFRLPIKEPTVKGEIKVEKVGLGPDRKAAGTIQAKAGENMLTFDFDVYLSNPARRLTDAQATASVNKSIDGQESSEQIAPAVYEALLKDFKAQREGSKGLFKFGPDIGDLHLVEVEHDGKPFGMIALRK
jgi:hypothetical protein